MDMARHEALEFMHQADGLRAAILLFGFSIGGVYSFNYAAEYPDKVAALYLDAPALDMF